MDANEIQARLAPIDLFQGLSKRALKQLVRSGRQTEHPDGHEVITEGAGAIGFHLIVAGTARVTSGGSVRRELGTGDYFGEISVIDGQPRTASVEAVGSLRTFVIYPHVFNSLLDDNPVFARRVLLLMCKRLREAYRHAAQ